MGELHASHPQWVLQVFNPDGDTKITAQEVIAGVDSLMEFTHVIAGGSFNAQGGHIKLEALERLREKPAGSCRIKTEAPSADAMLNRVKTLFTRMNIGNLVQDIQYPDAAALQPSIARWNKATQKVCSI